MIDYLSVYADQNEREKKNTFEFFKYCKVCPIRTDVHKSFLETRMMPHIGFYIRV